MYLIRYLEQDCGVRARGESTNKKRSAMESLAASPAASALTGSPCVSAAGFPANDPCIFVEAVRADAVRTSAISEGRRRGGRVSRSVLGKLAVTAYNIHLVR